jgi:hypothetical protein
MYRQPVATIGQLELHAVGLETIPKVCRHMKQNVPLD